MNIGLVNAGFVIIEFVNNSSSGDLAYLLSFYPREIQNPNAHTPFLDGLSEIILAADTSLPYARWDFQDLEKHRERVEYTF